jgi:uncharacterized repeat protein (TIGR02543 family)
MKIRMLLGFLCCLALILAGCGTPLTTYSVVYDSNGGDSGSVPVDGNAYANGQTVTVLGNSGSLARSEYSFSGWNTEADGSGSARTPGEYFCMGSTSVALYAQWRARAGFSVIYDGNGQESGSVPVDSNHYRSGDPATVSGNTGGLRKTGCVFAGWNTRADGGGSARVAGTSFAIPSENVVLYAQWGPYPIGGAGPAGGLVFYDKGFYSDGWRYMEAAPEDYHDKLKSDIELTGHDTGSSVGAGEENTYLLANLRSPSEAATICYNAVVGGFDDWFLPSLDELHLMFANLYLAGLGNFQSFQYWSSTYKAPNKYLIDFDRGYSSLTSRSGEDYCVRAARSF